MRNKTSDLSVQVLGMDHKTIPNAEVIVKSDHSEFRLYCENTKGFYRSEKNIPKGEYIITVNKKPFETDSRRVVITGQEQNELFILRKEGTPFYYRGKVKTPYTPFGNRIALVVPEEPQKGRAKKTRNPEEKARELIKKFNLKIEKQGENILANGILICTFPEKATEAAKLEIRQSIAKEKEILVAPILEISENNASLLTNEILVKFEEYIEEKEIQKIAKQYKLTIKRKISTLGNMYHFTTGETPGYAVLEISNKLAELESVIFAEPNLIHTVEEDAITPTDFLFPEQWDHQILNTPDAWQFLRNININRTFGNAGVLLAVVDSGVDPNNPDFNGNVSNGNAKISQSFDFVNMVANNNSRGSDHGTCCASAAAALVNNPSAVAGTNEGVAGVAGNCRILAIRRGGDEARYADMYLWAAGFDPESTETNFPATISPGADIITNSFGFSTNSPISGTMSAVFDRLTDDGRGGRGTLLFFSAGNANTDLDVTFARPWGMYNRCFSVAASSLDTDGATEVKADYSSFGSVVEFCAPSNDSWAPVIHNPPTGYGAFTATDSNAPEGDPTVGRPTVQTTLTAMANSGTNMVTVNSVAGMGVGRAIMFRNPGSGNTEAHVINAINNATNQVTLNRNLFNNHANGTNVFVTQSNHRSNFGGTSHATPLCAGTAALMLSANPQLTWTQVRDIMRNTAVKINPGENNANGRWQDISGNFSNEAAYDGNPVFSEFYGFGRIDAATAVRQAGWDIELVTTNLNFNDVPAGDTSARAVRFNVKSLWPANFHMTPPGSPFGTPLGVSQSIGSSPDANAVREVYLWVTFTGTNAGDAITMADGFSVTVTNPETEQEWVIPITANTIERETSAIMLSLDRSGSMDFPSGIGSSKRIDILRFSANILADVIQEGNGLGIVAFDHDPYDVLSLVGPLGPSTPFDVDRTAIKAAIAGFTPNPDGLTSIGNGIERAQLRLTPVSGYHSKSIIVFTDGKENRPKSIENVEDQINDRVFAVGLGKAQNINPAALNAITNNSGGYLLLTDELDENSIYKLAKYFLQILAGVNNEEIVVDPNGNIFPGQEHKIPFILNEGDISTDIILMLPGPHLIDFYLETPNGHILSPSDNASLPGLTYSYGNNVSFYRLNLPIPLGPGEREGKWHAILKINDKYSGKYTHLASSNINATSEFSAGRFPGGVPYTLLVHAYSNVKMNVWLTQDHFEPGADIQLNVKLSQYGIPLTTSASVTAELTNPAGNQSVVSFYPSGPGEYSSLVSTQLSGIYQFRIKASGTTFRGRSYTREQVRTAAVWQGGNRPTPDLDGGGTGGFGKEELCKLLSCLLNEKNITRELRERLQKNGINLEGMIECLQRYCKERSAGSLSSGQLSRLKINYDVLLKTYDEILKKE